MRWHPEVIKLCLANYHSQKCLKNWTKSEFINLPSHNLLQLYRRFDKQTSGWCFENIQNMPLKFEQSGKPLEYKVGMLIFDEMKIKEGLVWSAESNKLLDFTDIEYEGIGDQIATNIFQFFFKVCFQICFSLCIFCS